MSVAATITSAPRIRTGTAISAATFSFCAQVRLVKYSGSNGALPERNCSNRCRRRPSNDSSGGILLIITPESSRPFTVNMPVNITIQAKDVDSFRASQDQIMRDVQKGLDRAIRTIGRQSDIDDPTRRT